MSTLRLGSRGSPLALYQANLVADRLRAAGGHTCEIIVIKTAGDRLQERPLSEIGGKRLFVREIEDALLNRAIDLAVHSSKDMPAVLPDGLQVSAVLEREDARDALVGPWAVGDGPWSMGEGPGAMGDGQSSMGHGPGARGRGRAGVVNLIGTGSVRRVAQLRARFPNATFANVRGNLDTRLRKLDAGDYDLLVLAAAGLRRLGLAGRITEALSLDECIPAPGQGIIAIETRADDAAAIAAAAAIDHADTAVQLDAERALVTALGGGCQMPIGGIAMPAGPGEIELRAIVSSLDGARVIRYKKVGTRTDAVTLGRQVAGALLERGADDILSESRAAGSEPRHLT